MTEFLIKNTLTELLFNSRICESLEDKQIVDYLYEELMLEKLLYGEPVTVPELRAILRQKILNFQFVKLNGEIRDARGTLLMKYVPQDQHPKGIRPSSPKVATFYDLDKQDWRSVSQRSKEIVLKKDEDTGKPIVMVKDKPEDGDVAIRNKEYEEPIKTPEETPEETPIEQPTEQPDVTVDGEPIDTTFGEEPKTNVDVTNVKPIKSTENTKTFYFINPKTGSSEVIEMTPQNAIKALKKMGKDWKLTTKDEYEKTDEVIKAASEEIPDILEIGDTRNYLNRKGENVEIQIISEDPYGGVFAKTPNGGTFKIPARKMKDIGEKLRKEDLKTQGSQKDIINKQQNLDNLEANEI